MVLRLLLSTALAALLLAAPTAALAATPTPSPSASAPANPARDATWKKIDDHSAKLSWKTPTGATAKTSYVIIVNVNLGKKKVATYTKTDLTATSITYKNLPAGSKLSGEVTTSVRFAQGKHDKVPSYTQPQLKPSQVQNPMLVAIGVQLKASWKAPKADAGTLITGYHVVLYLPAASGQPRRAIKTVDLKADKTSQTFTKLEGTTGYYAFIQAVNSKGKGAVTQTNNAITGEAPFVEPTASAASTPTPLPTESATLAPSPSPSATATQPTPSTSAPIPVTSQTPAATSQDEMNMDLVKWAVIGGIIVILGALGLLGWRLYRRYV